MSEFGAIERRLGIPKCRREELGLGSSPGFLCLALNGGQCRGQISGLLLALEEEGTGLGVGSREKLRVLDPTITRDWKKRKEKKKAEWHRVASQVLGLGNTEVSYSKKVQFKPFSQAIACQPWMDSLKS